jgi:ATP-dependent Zn protease
MRDETGAFLMNNWISLAISWLPFLVLMGLSYWFFSRRVGMQARGSSGTTMIDLYEQQVAECRRMNLILERIATSLEKREGSSIPV